MSDIRFDNLHSLHWLWLVAAAAALVVWMLVGQRRALQRFASDVVIGRLLVGRPFGRRVARWTLVLVAMICLVVALLDPRWGVTYEEVRQQGIDVFVVLDVSRSMLGQDVAPSRLDRAKQYAKDLLEQMRGDRVGLIAFAGVPSLVTPLTVDYGAVRLALDEVGPELVGRGGSSLGDALRLAGESFTDEVKDYKAVVVLSDGEDHDSFPVDAARQLFDERGVRVFTVGIGDAEEGARIPVDRGGESLYLMHEGREVWSRMDPELLRRIALSSGGAFVPAGTRAVDLGRVYEQRIAPAAKREFGTTQIRRYHAQYQWFAALALLLLIAETLIGDRPGSEPPRSERRAGRSA